MVTALEIVDFASPTKNDLFKRSRGSILMVRESRAAKGDSGALRMLPMVIIREVSQANPPPPL